jgi:cell division protein DivIC
MASRTTAATPAAIGARRRLRLLMFVMILFLSWAAYTMINQHGQMSDRHAELRDAGNKLTDAEKKSDALKQEIVRLNDKEYISQIARKEQGFGLPGEQRIEIEKSAP